MRRSIGVALQEAALDPLMTGRELIRLQATLHGLIGGEAERRGDALIERVGLTRAADRRVGTYSGGMRRRLDLASALVHEPQGPVPRRADHRPRPGEPQGDLGGGRGAQRPRARPSSSPRSTWRRPTSSPTGSGSSAAGGSSPRARPASLKAEVGKPHLELGLARRRRRARQGASRRASAGSCPSATASSWSSSAAAPPTSPRSSGRSTRPGSWSSRSIWSSRRSTTSSSRRRASTSRGTTSRRRHRPGALSRASSSRTRGWSRRSARARSSRPSAARSSPRRSSSSRPCCSRSRRAAPAAPSTSPASRRSTTSSASCSPGRWSSRRLLAGNVGGIALAVDLEMGFTDRLLAAPISRFSIVAGRLAGSAALGAAAALWFIAIGLIFGASFELGVPGMLLMILFSSLAATVLRRPQRLDRALHRAGVGRPGPVPADLRRPLPLQRLLPGQPAARARGLGRRVQPALVRRRGHPRAGDRLVDRRDGAEGVRRDRARRRDLDRPQRDRAAAQAAGRLMGLAADLATVRALIRRAMNEILRVPGAAIPGVLAPTIFFCGLTAVFGNLTHLPGFETDSYQSFILPISMLQGAGFTGAATGVNLARDIEQGWFDRLLASPAPRPALLAGHGAVGEPAGADPVDRPAGRRLFDRRPLAGPRRPADRAHLRDGHRRRSPPAGASPSPCTTRRRARRR